jgi:glycosyltransferase involved in cell wall biosynthesis
MMPRVTDFANGADEPERIALVHDWLAAYVGGERVLEQMIAVYPHGDVFTSIDVLPAHEREFLQGKLPITSIAQHWPFMRKHFRKFLPLLMFSIEQLDVSGHELVLSSSASIGKGILTGPEQLHISYVHSPMRYAWEMQHQYLRDARLERGVRGLYARWLLHRARFWDLRTANGVDHFIANSHFIARRIWKVYRREATVIYPPVDVERFTLRENKEDFYLTASRLVPYKKVLEIVAAFRDLPDRRLVVIGDGTDMARVKNAAGANVEILGYQSTAVLLDHMQRARAFLFAAEEDFGITPVEAQACGTPVIAFGRGGAVETIRGFEDPKPTGIFFPSQEPAAISQAVRNFEAHQHRILPSSCRENALRFAPDIFRDKYRNFVAERWREFRDPQYRQRGRRVLAAS